MITEKGEGKMKKYLVFALMLMLALTLCSGLVACNGDNGNDDPDGDNNTYTVTFKVDGLDYKIIDIPESGSVTFPFDPAKAGYTFAGWYDGETKVTEITSDVKENKILIAKFTPITYTVTFKVDGTEVANEQFTVENKTVTEPSIPAKAGYTAAWESYTLGTESITVNAVYTPIVYTATFKADGVVVAVKEFTVETQSFTSPDVPEKNGYFGMWEAYTIGTENIVVNAVYTAGDYVVTFLVGQQVVGRVGFKFGDTSVTEPSVPFRQCYNGAWENYTLGSQNITVNAVYTLSHSALAKVPATDPKCNATGNIEYWACTGCNKYFSNSTDTSEITDKTSVILATVNCVYVSGKCKWCGDALPDLSGITMQGATYVADGTAKSIAVKGELPANITASYVGNSKTATGTYTVTAKLYYKGNYIDGADLTATLKIVTAGSYSTDGITYAQRTDGDYEVTGYTGTDPYVIIANKVNGKNVVSVKSYAFSGNAVPVYVYIPDTVTNIGNCAFAGTNITEIRISASLKTVGANAFEGLKASEIHLPDTVTAIGHAAFKGVALQEIRIPFVGGSRTSTNTHLGYIFGGDNVSSVPATLKTVIIGDDCTEIPAYAFNGCSAIERFDIGSSVTKIGNSAFAGCTSLTRIYIPANVTSIPANEYWYNSPFMNSTANLIIAVEGSSSAGFGRYWNTVTEDVTAIVVYGISYTDYLENKGGLLDIDVTSAKLSALYLNGQLISGFAENKTSYTATADINTGYKKVTAVATSTAATVKVVDATMANGGVATITVTSRDGQTVTTYTVTFNVTGTLNTSAAVVNKDGADATVSYVIDDGNRATGTFAKSMLQKYSYLNLSFAIYTKDFATLTDDGTKYVMDGDKYVYTQTATQKDAVAFWQDILSVGRSEIVSHTHTHSFWGITDEGGTFDYVKNDGTLASGTVLEGSTSKEIYASSQIIQELFPSSLYPNQKLQTVLINAGIGVKMTNATVGGVTYPTYYTYFKQVLMNAYNSGEYIGGRGTFMVSNTTASASYVTLPSEMRDAEYRTNVPAYMIVTENRNSSGSATEGGIDNWTAYIDHAIDQNGLAAFCIHNIHAGVTNHDGHKISEEDAEALFAYTADKNVWVATFTDATIYYSEWSTANVTTSYTSGKVKVTLTDSERNDIYNMALTVKVTVPAIWSTATVNGQSLEINRTANGNAYVYVNIIPDSGTVELIGG